MFFKYLDTCGVCNKYKLCCKYTNEFICEECFADANRFAGSGTEKLQQLRAAKGIYVEQKQETHS